MGLLLFLCLAPPCLVVIRRRRRGGAPFVLPLVAVVALLAGAVWSVATLAALLPVLGRLPALVQHADPSMKATLLAKSISALMSCAAVSIAVVMPLAVGGYCVDRWILARWTRRRATR